MAWPASASSANLSLHHGYYEISELLLSKGAIVDPMWERKSPLYIAAQYGNARIVELLLHHNAEDCFFPTEKTSARVYRLGLPEFVQLMGFFLEN